MIALDLLAPSFALLHFSADAPVPAWTAHVRHFLSIIRTPDELSIVADAAAVPRDVDAIRDYRAFRVRGPIPLDTVGVMAALAVPLAEAGVPILPLATWDTDYLLVRDADVERAEAALVAAGHPVTAS